MPKSKVDRVVEEWVKEQLENGEDPEIIKESLVLLNNDPSIVDKVVEQLSMNKVKEGTSSSTSKKEKKSEHKEEERDLTKKVEEIKKDIEKEIFKASPQQVIDDVRFNVPKEAIPKGESIYVLEHKKPMSNVKIKEVLVLNTLKRKFPYVLMLLGLSLMLIGLYFYFYM